MPGWSSLLAFVVAAGTPALVILFYLEGLVIGKVLQPPVLFVGFVAAIDPSILRLTVLAVLCLVAATLGQWTLYRGFDEDAEELIGIRRTVPYLDSVPERVRERVGETRLDTMEAYLDRHGVGTILVANSLPGVRGVPSIVAGTGGYPVRRFIAASTVGNAVYFALLSGAALGIGALARVFV